MAAEVVVEREIWIDAPPDVVFRFLVEPDKMVRWMGAEAEADPRPGGIYRLHVVPGGTASGRFVEVSPPDRVVFTWGWEESWNPMGSGTSTIEMTLLAERSGTTLRLRHSGLPEDQKAFHAMGWDHYLPRLQVEAAGKGAGPDPWRAGPPKEALAEIARFMP